MEVRLGQREALRISKNETKWKNEGKTEGEGKNEVKMEKEGQVFFLVKSLK